MNFKTELVPWIDEVKSYLKDSSKKTGELKKILRKADVSNLDYASQVKLSQMFDPACEVTEEVFRRQIDLYFSLLESKTAPIKLPVFSSYIDWIYSQDINRITDVTFDIISSRLLKTTATELSEPITSFMSRLPYEFERNIDTMTNSRLNTLVSILKETGNTFDKMPSQCRDFIQRMYLACAVKTEISDKNKTRFRGLFRDEPRGYYSAFNKAYAGFSPYDTWIDEPAKKITYERMIDYANYQSAVLDMVRKKQPLNYSTFQSCAIQLKLPRFPESKQVSQSNYEKFYLGESREYKTYAKKLAHLFTELVRSEVKDIETNYYGKLAPASKINKFAVTNDMKARVKDFQNQIVDDEFLIKYANFLIDLTNLDELAGQSNKDIYKPEANVVTIINEPKQENKTDFVDKQDLVEIADRPDGALNMQQVNYLPYINPDLQLRILNNCCTEDDLQELYAIYNELVSKDQRDLNLENALFDLELKLREQDEEDPSSNEKQK